MGGLDGGIGFRVEFAERRKGEDQRGLLPSGGQIQKEANGKGCVGDPGELVLSR